MQRILAATVAILSVLILIFHNYKEYKDRNEELASLTAINFKSPPLAAFFGSDTLDDHVYHSSWWISDLKFLFSFVLPSSVVLGLFNLSIFITSISIQKQNILVKAGQWLLTLFIFRLNSWIFTRGFGWKYPQFYFPMSDLEQNFGYGPLLIGHYLISHLNLCDTLYFQIALLIAIQYISDTGAFWWISASILSSLIVGCILVMFKKTDYMPAGRGEENFNKLDKPVDEMSEDEKKLLKEYEIKIKLRNEGYSGIQTLKNLIRALIFAALFNLLAKVAHSKVISLRQNSILHLIPSSSLTFIILSNPRSIDLVTETIKSIILSIETMERYTKSTNPFQILIYTSDANHSKYGTNVKDSRLFWFLDSAKFGTMESHRNSLVNVLKRISSGKWTGIRNSLSDLNQWNSDSMYYAIWEDDFPLCDNIALMNFLQIAWRTHHCGFHVATGGSGVIFPKQLLQSMTDALETQTQVPVDIVMQNCLKGIFCKDTCVSTSHFKPLIVPSQLLAKHTGWNASILRHYFPKDRWACNWRSPFTREEEAGVILI